VKKPKPAATVAATKTTQLTHVVTVEIPRVDLATYQKYCDYFLIPLDVLIQGDVIGQAEGLSDDIFATLEQFEELRNTPAPMETVALSFTDETHAVLQRLAQLLRMSLPELLQGLLGMGANTIAGDLQEAERNGKIESCPNLRWYGHAAVKFNLAERLGRPMASTPGVSLSSHFNIKQPAFLNAEVAA